MIASLILGVMGGPFWYIGIPGSFLLLIPIFCAISFACCGSSMAKECVQGIKCKNCGKKLVNPPVEKVKKCPKCKAEVIIEKIENQKK